MQPDLFDTGSTFRGASGVILSTRRFQRTNTNPPHYYRCALCLSVFTTENPLPSCPKKYRHASCLCACGNDSIEYMGQSTLDARLVREEMRCPCDDRCTSAQGPNCTCKCGGANHGSNLLISVRVDCGPVPRAELKNPQKAIQARGEFEKATADAYDRIGKKYGPDNLSHYRSGQWIDRQMWEGIRQGLGEIGHAKKLKTHRGRMAALEKVAR